jgi:hypothetical protein
VHLLSLSHKKTGDAGADDAGADDAGADDAGADDAGADIIFNRTKLLLPFPFPFPKTLSGGSERRINICPLTISPYRCYLFGRLLAKQ